MTNEDFIKNGYVRCDPAPFDKCVTDLFQKCVKDEFGKRYYINVKRWDFSSYHKGVGMINYEASVQFYYKDDNAVNIDQLSGWTIEEMERHYAELWDTGWFQYYEAFDGKRDEIQSYY